MIFEIAMYRYHVCDDVHWISNFLTIELVRRTNVAN